MYVEAATNVTTLLLTPTLSLFFLLVKVCKMKPLFSHKQTGGVLVFSFTTGDK